MTGTISHRSRTAFALFLALAAPAAAGPRDPLYQWADAAGAVRYTTEIERIPGDRRSAAIVISAAHGAARAAEPAASAAPQPTNAPAPATAPPGASEPTTPAVEAAPPGPSDEKTAALDARIAELEQSVAADEAALGDYISDPERAKRQRESGEVATIADRLPRLQNELRELRKQREAAAGAPPAPNAP